MRGTTILPTNWLFAIGLAALVAAALFATGVFLRTATAAPDCVNGAGGLAAYYFDGSEGTLNLSDGRTWVITLTNIDGSGVTGNKTYHMLVQDHGSGSGWETLPTQVHHDFGGSGGDHLLQSDDNGWTVRSSHGFNAGDVPGTYDLRVVMTQRGDDKWDVSPYFRLPGDDWTLFFDGAWTTATAFDLTKTRVAVAIDGGGGGTLCFTAPTANAVDLSNVFVDDDWAGLADGEEVLFPGDVNPHYMGLDAFATVQDGIDNVAGSTVNIADGTYTATSLASVVITKDGLSLIGQSRDGTIIDGGVWGTSNAGWPKGIHVYANDVTVQDLTVRGFTGDMVTTGGYGIVFRDYAHDMPGEGWIFYTGGVVDNVKVENNYSAIYALVNRNLTVRDSLIQNNFSDGMFIARESDNATITGNTVLNSGDHGIWVGYDWGALGPSDNATITGNVVDGAREGGISFVASDTALISANDVSNVKGEEPEGTGGWSRGAISLKDGVSNVTVSNNIVHDNDGLGTGSGRGIGVDGTSSNITVTGNVIRNNAGGGVKIQGTTSGWSANSNSIHSNTGYEAENTTGSVLDFSGNWWGTNTAAGVAAEVSTLVDYSPWLDSGADTDGGTPGFQGDFSILHVDDDSPQSGSTGHIQEGIDLVTGSTVLVEAGTYDEALDIDGRSGLTIDGEDNATVTLAPTSTLCWNVSYYGCGRQAVVRVVDSTDVVIRNMTMDFNSVKANSVFGVLYWDSTGQIASNVLKNMSVDDLSGGYYEFGAYLRAPGYTDAARANITVSGNTFIDAGRVATLTHDYVDATITGNTFYKILNDFGYAIELGSQSTGTISGNTIYGYDTAAASDGSESAGIYIENAFTGGFFPLVTGVTKDVSITNNEVYDSQWGLVIGNEFDSYAGDVDISVTLEDNDFHDNLNGGVLVSDEDKENGSSVTVNGGGNTLAANGSYGYYIYTQGDGDITVALTGEAISGHDTGVYVEDTAGGSSTSSYSIAINESNISGNTSYGINNTIGTLTVDGEKNWWGDATGADHASNPHGTGQGGDAASDNVDFTPWYATSTTTSNTENVTVTHNPVIALSDTIQGGIDAALDGDAVDVSAGTYTETVTVNKDVTLAGLNPPAGGSAAVVNGTIDLTADGATVESLRVVPGSVTGDERAIAVSAGNTTVTGNLIDGMTGDGTGSIYGVGIHRGSKPALLNISVTNNVIRNIDNQQPGVPYSGATGIQVQGVVNQVDVIGNTIEDIHSAGWAFGIEVTPTGSATSNPPQNVLVQLNSIGMVNDGSVYDVLAAPFAAPYPGVGFGLDEAASVAGDASQVTVTNNSFAPLIIGAMNKDTAHILNAENNWWGACDGPSGEGPGSGAYVSTYVDYDPWEAGKCDKDNDLLSDDEEIFVYFTDPNNPDTDGDGCMDGVEVLPKSIVANGGGRDPLNQWDFYDVTGDKYIDLFNDILGVIQHYSLDGSPPYDVSFDRGPSAGPNPWNMTAPDGSIDLFIDILGVIGQHGHDCT